jgi:GTP-binding protein YchF
MKLGIIGLPQSGKSTIFAALTGARGEGQGVGSSRTETRLSTVTVVDERLGFLSELYQPKKTTYAKMEYLLPGKIGGPSAAELEGKIWNEVRVCDALIQVVRNFKTPGGPAPSPEEDFRKLQEEMIVNDLVVAEKRIERIELDGKRGKKPEGDEYGLVKSCRECLESGQPIRKFPELASKPGLRGFTFLSAKPILVIINNEDEDEESPQWEKEPQDVDILLVRGRLEMDIASMPSEEAEEFLEAYNIHESALDRVIACSYQLLNRIFFFTVISDEVRAWSVASGTPGLEAAGTVHSDMKRGFIRAEVVSFNDLKACGDFQKAKKAGVVRLEGKNYEVKDGDIINFRFNV